MLNRDQIAHEYILSGVATTVHSAFQLADAMIAEAQKRKNTERPAVVGDGWIYIKDQKPKEGQSVAIYFGLINEEVNIVSYITWTNKEYSFKGNINYIAWQPLPSPPKGVAK